MNGYDFLTRREFIDISLTILGIFFSLSIAIFSIMVKYIVDKARIEAINDNKELEVEIDKIKNNYLGRFDDLKKDINELKILVEKRFAEMEIKIIQQKMIERSE